jgi:hypothetical protein
LGKIGVNISRSADDAVLIGPCSVPVVRNIASSEGEDLSTTVAVALAAFTEKAAVSQTLAWKTQSAKR